MNSRDIYIKVGKLLNKNKEFSLVFSNKDIKVEEIECAFIDYTNEKIFEVDTKSDYVEDLGVMFDLLESKLSSEKEKDEFFNNYVFAMINILSNITDTQILWSPDEEKKEGVEYPSITSGECIRYFTTTMDSPSKENALWLFGYIKKNLNKENDSDKKLSYKLYDEEI